MTNVIEDLMRAIEDAQCAGREGPYGQYDFRRNAPGVTFSAPYRIRDMRDPEGPTYCQFIAKFDDHDECCEEFKRLTEAHVATAALRALLSGPVGDVLRAALDAAGNAEPLPKAVLKAAEALPSEITDTLGGE